MRKNKTLAGQQQWTAGRVQHTLARAFQKLHEACLPKRIHGGVEVLEQEEGSDDDQDQEECVVVEDGEGGGLVVCNFILLPQDPDGARKQKLSRVPAEPC